MKSSSINYLTYFNFEDPCILIFLIGITSRLGIQKIKANQLERSTVLLLFLKVAQNQNASLQGVMHTSLHDCITHGLSHYLTHINQEHALSSIHSYIYIYKLYINLHKNIYIYLYYSIKIIHQVLVEESCKVNHPMITSTTNLPAAHFSRT